jgi:triosephosphate isomerase
MLAEVGCRYVILGHSERREHFSETNRRVNAKAKAALFWGLIPIICVGEKADERASGHATMVVEKQLKRCLSELSLVDGGRLMIAYEPVWAIGTGHTPTTQEIDGVHGLVRSELVEAFGKAGTAVPILYGGSVKPSTVGPILALDSVDGALVGGASLEPGSFLAIVEAARSSDRGRSQ